MSCYTNFILPVESLGKRHLRQKSEKNPASYPSYVEIEDHLLEKVKTTRYSLEQSKLAKSKN